MNTELMKDRRRVLGVDQETAAKAVGVSVSAWRGWEQGARQPRAMTASRIASYLGVSLDELLGHKAEPAITLLDSVTERASELTDEEKYELLRFISYLVFRRHGSS